MKLWNLKEQTKNLTKSDQVVLEAKKKHKNNGITSTSLALYPFQKFNKIMESRQLKIQDAIEKSEGEN